MSVGIYSAAYPTVPVLFGEPFSAGSHKYILPIFSNLEG